MNRKKFDEARELVRRGLASDVVVEFFGVLEEAESENRKLLDGMEVAWGIIANAGGGDWKTQGQEWEAAARKWRDEHWHPALDRRKDCRHAEIVEDHRDPDGSIWGRCAGCGDNTFPIRDVAHEEFVKAHYGSRECLGGNCRTKTHKVNDDYCRACRSAYDTGVTP